MKKWKASARMLVTLLLLIAIAFVPALVGQLQDTGLERNIHHRSLHSIAPYLSEKGSGLSFEEKLATIQSSNISMIVPELASMSHAQVYDAVKRRIEPFLEAGIFRSFASWELHATPYIAISWQDSQRYFLFWDVSLVETDSNYKYSLSARLDDETGKLLDLHYYRCDFMDQAELWEEKQLQLDDFAQLWLEQAELEDKAHAGETEQQFQGEYLLICSAAYEIETEAFGSLRIWFSLARTGEFSVWTEIMHL